MKLLLLSYSQHPRICWAVFLIVGWLFILGQSFLALPRDAIILFVDSLFPTIVVVSGSYLLTIPKNINLIFVSIIYFLLTLATFFSNIIPKPYGTFFFLLGSWLFVDWYNFRKYRSSIFSEIIVVGNSRLALGIFLSTFLFGLITELVNLPFLVWQYNIPLPSLKEFGVPALVATFGWTPWTLSILAIFFPYTFRSKN